MKISTKLSLSFAVTTLLILFVGTFGVYKMNVMSKNIHALATSWLPSIKAIGVLNRDFSELRRYMLLYVNASTDEARVTIEKGISTSLAKVRDAEKKYESLISTDVERKTYEEYTKHIKDYMGLRDKLMSLIKQNRRDDIAQVANIEMPKVAAAAQETLSKCVDLNDKGGTDEAALGQAAYEEARLVSIILLLGATITGALLSILIPRSIVNPLAKSVTYANRLSVGDLSGNLDVNLTNEIGMLANALRNVAEAEKSIATLSEQLAKGDLRADVKPRSEQDILLHSLKSMVTGISEVVMEIQEGAERVAAGSEQLSSTAQSISQGSSEQAAAVEESSSSMEEMASSIVQNADNAKQTEAIAFQSSQAAQDSGHAVIRTVEAMNSIATKISIIEEIARQTDLLALNAAIEAARAGEHGKGFAVVASEVRKLAERSQAAAGEINQMSTESMAVAQKAGDLLQKLVPDIQKTAQLVQEISAASAEQSTGASQVNTALQQLDQVVQQNASASEQLASTAEELSSQSEQLQSVIGFFKIENQERSRRYVPQSLSAAKSKPRPSAPRKTQTPSIRLELGGSGVEDDRSSEFEKF